ncbi:hypothetical protein BJX99DRAFT_234517, partial [Aspergillus californicus]
MASTLCSNTESNRSCSTIVFLFQALYKRPSKPIVDLFFTITLSITIFTPLICHPPSIGTDNESNALFILLCCFGI